MAGAMAAAVLWTVAVPDVKAARSSASAAELPAAPASNAALSLSADQAKALALRTVPLRPAAEGGRLRVQGQVVRPPALVRVVSATVPALVEQVLVGRGDAVRAGQPLLLLAAPQIVEWQREYSQARLQVDLARKTAQRDAALVAEGLIPAARAQASQNQLQMAEAALAERTQLLQLAGTRPGGGMSGRVTLSAPADGQVVELMAQPGMRVEAGVPLLTLARRGALALELQVPADVARRLRPGDAVWVPGCEAPARIVTLNAQLDGATQTQVLRAQWAAVSDCVVPQQRVEVEVMTQEAVSGAGESGAAAGPWRVPAPAVVRHAGSDAVFVQRGGGYLMVAVRVLGREGSGAGEAVRVATLRPHALSATDAVVVQGAVALKGLAQGLGAE